MKHCREKKWNIQATFSNFEAVYQNFPWQIGCAAARTVEPNVGQGKVTS